MLVVCLLRFSLLLGAIGPLVLLPACDALVLSAITRVALILWHAVMSICFMATDIHV